MATLKDAAEILRTADARVRSCREALEDAQLQVAEAQKDLTAVIKTRQNAYGEVVRMILGHMPDDWYI